MMAFGMLSVMIAKTQTTVSAWTENTPDVRVTGAWARPGETMSAAYLQIHNDEHTDDRLVAVRVLDGTAEIHETQIENDVMHMQRVDGIDIPAGEMVRLEPGGHHIMLMRLQEPLLEGDRISLTLVFGSGAEVSVHAWVSHTPIPYEYESDALTEQALAAVSDSVYVGQVVNPPVQVQDFVAPGSDAGLTRLSDTNGTWRVIFFGYMHCPDFCPLTLVDYRAARQILGEDADKVTFMLVSVDSVRDEPETIRRYLDNFDPTFVGFSPDDVTLSRIQLDYGFYYERRMDSGSQAVYTIDHSTRSYLLDPDGVL
ncbi:MAG: copper chaperone PCu(A)C [Chloroflexota bacterium]